MYWCGCTEVALLYIHESVWPVETLLAYIADQSSFLQMKFYRNYVHCITAYSYFEVIKIFYHKL